MSTEPVKVIYLMAYGRSGSTIVGNILGEMDGFVHVGELRYLWARMIEGRLCGCLVPVADCPLWSEVVPSALAEAGGDVKRVRAWQREGVRLRYLRRLLRGGSGAPGAAAAYAAVVARLYRRVAERTGSRVIVDSSKRIADAALLGWQPGVEPYFVQLVRDPRAVAYSWRRTKNAPGEGAREQLQTLRPSVTARSWAAFAVGAALVRRRHRGRSMLVRYEDFAANPRQLIESLVELVGESPAGLPFVDDRTVELGPNHTVGGNPVRLRSGPTTIREDDEWVMGQAPGDRRVVTAITLPLLRSYRYPLRPAAAAQRAGP